MTTIAYRDGVLAADTLVAYTTYTNGYTDKIAYCGGHLVALAGAAFLRVPLEEWVTAGCNDADVPDVLLVHKDKFQALIVDEQGRCWEFDHGFLVQVKAQYTAIGSGGQMAMGAMAFGASAVEAVHAACQHDKNSGGGITQVPYHALLAGPTTPPFDPAVAAPASHTLN